VSAKRLFFQAQEKKRGRENARATKKNEERKKHYSNAPRQKTGREAGLLSAETGRGNEK